MNEEERERFLENIKHREALVKRMHEGDPAAVIEMTILTGMATAEDFDGWEGEMSEDD